MKTIAVYSLKGGTGKTITTATLGHLYATYRNEPTRENTREFRVLLVDADTQGNLSQYFKRYSYSDGNITNLLDRQFSQDQYCYCGTDWPFMNIVTSGPELYQTERKLYANTNAQEMKRELTAYQDSYNICLIDCAPSLNMVTINALCAADYLIIPIRIDAFSSNGLVELDTQLKGVRKINEKLQIAGIVITHYQNTPIINDAVKLLQDCFPVFQQKISYSRYIAESTLRQIPLAEISMRIGPTVQYRKLLNELLLKMSE